MASSVSSRSAAVKSLVLMNCSLAAQVEVAAHPSLDAIVFLHKRAGKLTVALAAPLPPCGVTVMAREA